MNGFKSREIVNQETLGQRLKEAREKKKFSLKRIEEVTKIQAKYFEALEAGQYEKLPSDVYTKNFLKVYAAVLGLSFEPLFKLYQQERSRYEELESKIKMGRSETRPRWVLTPRIIKNSLIGLVALLLLIYLALGISRTIEPPRLTITSPEDKLTTNQMTIKVAGQTEPEVKVTINNQEVVSDVNGYFEKEIDLQKGINIIKITAVKSHSRDNIVSREVLVE